MVLFCVVRFPLSSVTLIDCVTDCELLFQNHILDEPVISKPLFNEPLFTLESFKETLSDSIYSLLTPAITPLPCVVSMLVPDQPLVKSCETKLFVVSAFEIVRVNIINKTIDTIYCICHYSYK